MNNTNYEDLSLEELELMLRKALKHKGYVNCCSDIKQLQEELEDLEQSNANYLEFSVKPIKDAIITKFKKEGLEMYDSLKARRKSRRVVDTSKIMQILTPEEICRVAKFSLKDLDELQEMSSPQKGNAIKDCITKHDGVIVDISIL